MRALSLPVAAESLQPSITFAYWRFTLVVFCACVLLVAREPHKLLHPQFIAEDGSIFFAQTFNVDIGATFFTRYAGYYHLIPRLIAAIGITLPYALIPLFYSLASLVVTALALTWFYLPQHRHLVQSDAVRLATVLIFLCAPNLAALMQIAYLQWPLAVWALLVALTPLPAKSWQAWLIVLVYLLVIGTAPVVIVWLPVWLWRLYNRNLSLTRSERGWDLQRTQLLCLSLTHGLIVFSGLTAPRTLPSSMQNPWLILLDFGRGFIYQAGVLNLLGRGSSEWLWAHGGWWTLYGVGLGMGVMLLLAIYWQPDRQKRFLSFLLLYVILTSSLLYINRAELLGYIFANNLDSMHRGAARYFWAASVALYLLLAIQVDSWLAKRVDWHAIAVSAMGYLMVLGLYSYSFFIPPWGDIAWTPHVRLLEYLDKPTADSHFCQPRTSQLATVGNRTLPQGGQLLFLPLVAKTQLSFTAEFLVHLPIAPPDWVMKLAMRDAPVQHVTADLTLVAAEEQIVEQALRVRLFWQGKVSDTPTHSPYKITVFLLDQQGQQLASDEARFDPPNSDKADVPMVFSTQHTLALPSALGQAEFNLAVTFYPPPDPQWQSNEPLLVNNCTRYRITGTP